MYKTSEHDSKTPEHWAKYLRRVNDHTTAVRLFGGNRKGSLPDGCSRRINGVMLNEHDQLSPPLLQRQG